MKRSALVRKSPMVANKAARKAGETKLRRKCSVKGCKEQATTFKGLKGWCGVDHGAILAESALTKKRAEKELEERKSHKIRKDALFTIPQLKSLAQREFNAFIRERDKQAGFPCISSNKPLNWNGNDVDAGHYRSTGSADHLRFNEDNCHAQSKQDNRYKAGNAVDYRINLIKRIGLDRVEALENNNEVVKWTREILIEKRKTYQVKLRALRANQQGAD